MRPEEENTMLSTDNIKKGLNKSGRIRGVMNQLQAFLALIILCIVMSILSDNFFTIPNLINVLMQNTIICIIAMA